MLPMMQRYVRVRSGIHEVFARVEADHLAALSTAPWLGGKPTGERLPSDAARLVPVTPNKLLGVGKNYRAHAAEMGGDVPSEPLLFFKANTSLLEPGGRVVLPEGVERTDYEGELAVVIGRRCRNVSAVDAPKHVFGYGVLCDVTARDWQRRDGQWWRAKGFDTACPFGAEIVTEVDPSDLRITLTQNDELKQDARTSQMVFDVPTVIAHISAAMTLEPGDVIATGTPAGVGPLGSGDRVRVEVEHVGTLDFSVA